MKVNKITKLFLSMFIIYLITLTEGSCTEVGKISSSSSNLSKIAENTSNLLKEKKLRVVTGSISNTVNQKHKSHKKLQKLKTAKSNVNQQEEIILSDITSEANIKSDHTDQNISQQTKQTDSILYISWFIFIPLVLLIFIMTILSIAGFLILILSSTGSHNHSHPTSTIQTHNLRENMTRLSNDEIIQILRYKQQLQLKKKSKKTKNNYKPEPEPEGALLKN